jgi:protein SCO1/2
MSKGQRIVTLCLWGLLLLTMVGVVTAKLLIPHLTKAEPPAAMFPAAQFSLVDQNGATFSSDTLRGKPYIASFMFTKCAGVCPKMNGEIARLQRELPPEYQFVSFTTDPANDDAKTLKAYGQALGADESRWHFLTGPLPQLQEAAAGMKVTNKDWPAGHTDRLILVDPQGNIRGTYHAREPDDLKQLVKDAGALSSTGAGASS